MNSRPQLDQVNIFLVENAVITAIFFDKGNSGPTFTYFVYLLSLSRECVSMGAVGARTRRSLKHHLLHPLILRLLVLCAPAVLRPRALQDAPAPADPNS